MTGWVLLAAFVAGYDAHAAVTGRPSLSAAYTTALANAPAVTLGGTALVVAHLLGRLPPRCDPLHAWTVLFTRKETR